MAIQGTSKDHLLMGVRAKYGWARQRLNDFRSEASGFLERKPYSTSFKRQPDQQTDIFYLKILEEPPMALGLIMGDFLYAARSCLDHLAFALTVSHTGRNPPPKESSIEFPIFKDPVLFKQKAPTKIGNIDAKARDVIEELQPYQRGNAADLHPLWVLQSLGNIDKHRYLHTPFVRVGQLGTWDSGRFIDVNTGPLEDGAEILRWRWTDPPRDPNVQMNPTLRFQIGAGQSPFVGPASVRLNKVLRFLSTNLPRFNEFF